MIKDDKILYRFGKSSERGEDIYTILKCKYSCYKVMGVDIVKSAYIGFSNKNVLVEVKESIGNNFTKIKYKDILRFDLIVNPKFFEIKIELKDGSKMHITNIKDFDEMDFLVEIANIVNIKT